MERSFFLYPGPGAFVERCTELLVARGWRRVDWAGAAAVAVAPCLTRKLGAEELALARVGTLVFHPSLLPLRRGPDAIRWQILEGDAFGGVSWFWAAPGLDEGEICEQELVALPAGLRPREAYERVFAPAGLRCLERAAAQMELGYVRRVAQDSAAATYQSWHPSRSNRS